MRRLAKAERLHQPEEAAQARALLRRASEMQQLYDQHFKQSETTRERLSRTNANARDSNSINKNSQINSRDSGQKSVIGKNSGPPLLLPSSETSTRRSRSHSSSHRHGSKQTTNRSYYPSLPPDKPNKLPNFPLLDVCTGQWRGLWDLFPVIN